MSCNEQLETHAQIGVWYLIVKYSFGLMASIDIPPWLNDQYLGAKVMRTGKIMRLIVMLAMSMAAFLSSSSFAQSFNTGTPFDHGTTGFYLDGAHVRERCESCHVQGMFRGTPRDCAGCHRTGGRAPGKAPSHIPTITACEACHQTVSWSPSTFRHRTSQGITIGSCAGCHNGSTAPGKLANHLPTTAACDSCHKTSAWVPAGYTHALAKPGDCASCHEGRRATGKSVRHIPSSGSCDRCHNPGVAWVPASVGGALHASMAGPVAAGNCATCHDGRYLAQNAQAKPVTHISTSEQCDVCHSSLTSWAVATFDHTLVTPSPAGICSSCHGTTALGKPTSHVPTAQQCDSCHTNFTAFKPAQMNHAGAAALCSTCHGGSHLFANALAKPVSHIPTAAQCDSCHAAGLTAWTPAAMNHSGLAGKCITCHSGGFLAQGAQVKSSTHVPTTAQCDACHQSTTTWATRIYDHAQVTPPVAGRCSTCHNGAAALGKPATHVPTTAQCDSCHSSLNAFKPAAMNHAGVAGQCNACHNGNYVSANALARPVGHIPGSGQCDTCHVNGYVSWRPATMNHNGLAGLCSACHSGAYLAVNALAKPATHLPTTAQCDTCHTGTMTWASGTFNHVTATPSVVGRCTTCHNGSTAVGKPATHITTGQQCDSCHTNYTAFTPAVMNHAGLSGQCSTCHNGAFVAANAQTKPVTHVPTGAQCDVCHTNGYLAFSPSTVNHAATTAPVAAGNCTTCHSGTYLAQNAQVKPATHVATTQQCDVCHKSTSSWATDTLNHALLSSPAAGRCSSCHNGTSTGIGKPSTHVPTTAQCDVCHSGFVAFAPSPMNHAGTLGPVAAANCNSCHNGSFTAVNARAKPATHIITTQSCDACHTTVAWTPTSFSHTGVVAGSCATCHNGTAARGKVATHLPTSSACDVCHNTLAFAPATMSHAGTNTPVSTGNCSTCHSGAYLAINAQVKPATHVATTAQCDSCHSSTTTWATATFNHASAVPAVAGRCASCHNGTASGIGKPTNHIPTSAQCDSCHANFTAFAPAAMNHAGVANLCSNCHNGAYLFANAQTKPANHLATSAQCDTCHIGTVTWLGAAFNHVTATPSVVGRCTTCHNGSTAVGKPATHITTGQQCDSCHTNYTAFTPAVMNHAGLSGQCSTCHNGAFVAANAQTKPVTHVPTGAQCDVCHTNGYLAFSPSTVNHAATTAPVAAGNCTTCHSGTYLAQNAQVKPATHVATTQQCDVCHKSTSSWATDTLNHALLSSPAAGRCSSCHNGTSTGIGKPSTHVPTTAQCDVCHSGFVAFAPSPMNHAGTLGPVAAANCNSCHNGSFTAVNARAKPATHIITTQSCDACHTTVAWTPTSFSHTGVVAGSCATCHNGTAARGKVATHLPTSSACDVCHNTLAFAPATMSHAGTNTPVSTGNCSTCHSGAYLAINAQVKPATHVATTAQCDSCHSSTTTWATATFNHAAAVPPAAGRCSTCHGSTALGKPTSHIPSSAQCDLCHTGYVAFRPATVNHAATAGPVAAANCNICHSGTYTAVGALAKPAGHIPTTSQCDSCHTRGFVAFRPAVMNHTGLAGQCSTCHSGAYVAMNALTKPATHIPTTAQCDTCHTGTSTWATGTLNHATVTPSVAGRCTTCHNGTTALGKPANHVPSTAQCDTCHKIFTAFAPAVMSHSGTIGPVAAANCATCHNGAYVSDNAVGKPAIHLPTTQSCDVCHTTTAWTPSNFAHGTSPGVCTTCHNGTTAVGKPVLHIPTTQVCDVCHRTSAWLPLITPYAHAGVVAGDCASCHTSAYPNISAKPAVHVPTTAVCDACHSRTNWLMAGVPAYNHSGVGTTCQTCHGGAYPGVTIKVARHVPTTTPTGSVGNECSRCHTSTTSWLTGSMQHGTMQTSCRTCHLSTATYQGTMDKMSTSHEGMGTKDCSSSGCHRPLGSRGTAYTRWD